MSLTDKRIEEILKEVEPRAVRLPLGWKLFARAIEAEATKPQEPVAWVEVVDRHEGPYNFHGKELLDSGKHNLYTTPKPCQSCAEKQSAIDVWEGRYADLSAKCAELEDFCISQGNELAKLDEKVFDQDRLLKQHAEKISATLVALAGLSDGALDGGWTYAGMNKYALGLEAKCAELKAECAAMRENSKRWHGLFDTAVASLERSENNTVIKELEADRDLHKAKFEAINKDFDAMEAERDALAMQNQQLREALELAAKTISDLETSGDLDTETIPTLMEALALPDTSEIIKQHDAAVLRKAAEHLHAKARAYLNEFDRRVAHDMASALEKSCPPSN